MSTARIRSVAAFLALVLALVPGLALGANKNQNETLLTLTLTPSLFAPSNAIGDATYEIRRYRSDFSIDVADLYPGTYDVLVGGVKLREMAVQAFNGGTEGRVAFSTKPTAAWEATLGVDPRGKTIQIVLGNTLMLSGTFPTVPNPEAPDDNPSFNNVVETITAVHDPDQIGPQPRGTLHLVSGSKHASLQFELQRLENTVHTITANGVTIAYFTPLAGGIARVRFSTDPSSGEYPLDFDPANTTFLVDLNGETILEFKTGPDSIGGGTTPIGVTVEHFNTTDAAPEATGDATLRDRATSFDFDVEVSDLPVGSYHLLVGGVSQATIAVSIGPDGTSGFISFSTLPTSNPPKPALTFDPHGQTIQIVQGDTVFLSLTFPN